MCVCVLILCFISLHLVDANPNEDVQFKEGLFRGFANIREVECRANGDVKALKIFDKRDNSTNLVSLSKKDGETCTTSSAFAACSFKEANSPSSVAGRVLITDLQEGDTREYRCVVVFEPEDEYSFKPPIIKDINVTGPSETAPTSGPRTTNSADEPSGTEGQFKDATLFSNSVVIFLLVLLVITMTAVCVVGAIYCKRRNRKRRKRDCDSLSMRSGMTSKSFYGMSDKGPQFGFDDGPGMQTLTRQLSYSSSAPPKAMAPDVPGQIGRVMQYQKPTDCMPYGGTMASVRSYQPPVGSPYHEPWGKTLDDPEIMGRLNTVRGNRGALVKIPDFEASSSSASYPAPPSAAPTQETGPTIIEKRE
ncbi:hypothetical protein V1264_017637 [Littorina saxatilis]|uniref:Uncharacterized protein n=2 Tax=Littorina saxatilis TaxID=31220 RepID=A0AAN9BIW9_9CAEN